MRALVILRDMLLTVTAILGVISVVAVGAALTLDIRPLVVVSGSMEPGIPTGSLVLGQTTAASNVQVGDVVTVPRRTGTSLVTHRVMRIVDAGSGQRELFLRGDANDTDDLYSYVVSTVREHRATIPGAGYVAEFFQTSRGLILVFAVMAVIVVLLVSTRGESRHPSSDDPAEGERRGNGRSTRTSRHLRPSFTSSTEIESGHDVRRSTPSRSDKSRPVAHVAPRHVRATPPHQGAQ